MRLFKLSTALTFVLALAACVQGPLITSFNASDTTVAPGTAVTLSWSVGNPGTLTLTPGGDVTGQNKLVVKPQRTTFYTLTATKGTQSETKTVEVVVVTELAIQSFAATPPELPESGGQVELAWQVVGEGDVTLLLDDGLPDVATGADNLDVSNRTSFTISNLTQSAVFTLTAKDADGETSAEATVTVGNKPFISTFEANDTTVTAGAAVTLSWNVVGDPVPTVSLDGQPVTGTSAVVRPTATTTYTLTANNSDGDAEPKKVTVTVGQAPTVSLSASPTTVAPNGRSTLSWSVGGTEPISLKMNNNVDVSGKGLNDSVSVTPAQTTTYTLTATNDYGAANVSGTSSDSETVTVKQVPLPTGDITLLIAGQSNASSRGELDNVEPGIPEVRMFGNDYVWKQASEPTDSNLNQVDKVSKDTDPNFTFGAGHSFGVRLGKDLHDVTGKDVFLIQSAKGGSCLTTCEDGSWSVPSNRLNRSTLFGSANYRAQVSAGTVPNPVTNSTDAEGGPVTGIIWYQGESEQGNVSGFIRDTNTVMDAFQSELNDPPIIYAQIARRLIAPNESDSFKNVNYQNIREKQRLMETQYGNPGDRRNAFYMVVTHDLPMIEHNHLSAEGQEILGDRIALAYQEHVLGQGVDGTGPRLESGGVTLSGNVIKVNLDRPVNDSSDYEGYFNVSAGGSSYSGVSGNITSITRDPSDPSAILVTVKSTSSPLFLRYMPPAFKPTSYPTPQLQNVVKSTDTGLPLPAFGPLKLK